MKEKLMFVVIDGDRIIGRSTTLFGADAIRQQKRRGVLYKLLSARDAEKDLGISEPHKTAEKTADFATSMQAQ